MGFEPTISGVTGQYVNRYTTGPKTTGLLTRLFQCRPSDFRCQGRDASLARSLSCQALLGGLSCGLQSWHDKYAQYGQVRDISLGNLPGRPHCIGVGLQLGLEHGLPGRSLGALHFFRVLHQDDLAGDADGRRQYRRRSGSIPGVA